MNARKYKRYPAYKDSRVDWLGKLPTRWEAKRLKNCVLRLESGGTPESDNSEYWTDDEAGIPWVAISDMSRSFHVRDTAKRLTELGLRSKRLPLLPAGTLLYSMYASLGKVALLEINAVVNQAILGLVTRDELVSVKYLRWWLEFMQGHVQLLSSSNTQDNLNADKVRKMPVFVPGSDEQRAIAAFLDRETARIDALVVKKERLIELLQEQRTALITRAVTMGLDPTVPMRDSGVEWLGEIPAHWEVKPLSRTLLRITYGFTNPMPVADAGPYMLTALDIGDGEILYGNARRTTEEAFERLLTDKSRPKPGDILITKDGTLGRVAVAGSERVCINQSVALLRLDPGAEVGFMQHILRAAPYQERMTFEAGGTAIKHIYIGRLARMTISLPAKEEQRAIAAFLDRETMKIDSLIAKIRDAIDGLNELRTALISAAVTGKIDVREVA